MSDEAPKEEAGTKPVLPEVDWSAFDAFPKSICRCRCGFSFRSHAKYVMTFGLVTRTECLGCKRKDNVWSVIGEPETMTIKGSGSSS